MSSAPFFKDIGKRVEKLFCDGYDISVNVRSPSAVYLKADRYGIRCGNFDHGWPYDYINKYCRISLTCDGTALYLRPEVYPMGYPLGTKIFSEINLVGVSLLPRRTVKTFGACYRNNYVAVDGAVHPNNSDTAIVFRFYRWFCGYSVKFDAQRRSNCDVALGYCSDTLDMHAILEDEGRLKSGIFFKATPDLKTGLEYNSYLPTKEILDLGLGFEYKRDPETVIRAKINNWNVISAGLTRKCTERLSLSFSLSVDTEVLNIYGCRCSFGVDFQ